jgi:choline-sulfatase
MNFIFFMPDELRAESVGCYGHPLAPTPNLDALAAQGTRFDQCHVQHSVCTPSRCSLMTGWYPHVRGHRTLWHMLRPDEPNLLRTLRRAGYQVHWYGKNDLLAQESFADSVDVAQRRGSGMHGVNPFAPDDPRHMSFLYAPYTGALEDHSDYANVQAGIGFLRSGPQQPFVLYLPLTFPHCPYSAPEPWHSMFDPDALPDLRPPNLPNRPDFHPLIRQYRALDQLPEDEQRTLMRQIGAVYLGMTAFVDHLLGQLLTALDESGLADETTVMAFSDHGDYAGDYGLVEKWPSAGEDLITRVPLVIRTPGGAAGHLVQTPVELFDVMATTLALAGVEAEHTHFAHNLVPQLHGAAGDSTRAAFTEGGYARHEPHCFEGTPTHDRISPDRNIYTPKRVQQQEHPDSVGRTVAMRTGTHRLVYRPTGQCELYDLAQDPRELHNRYDDPAYHTTQQALTAQLLAWLVQTSDVTPFDIDARGIPA